MPPGKRPVFYAKCIKLKKWVCNDNPVPFKQEFFSDIVVDELFVKEQFQAITKMIKLLMLFRKHGNCAKIGKTT